MNEDFEKDFIKFYDGEREKFQAHIFKANHHGSQDFCPEFLKRISPSISIVSAGYAYNYGHPRANLLGSLGRYSSTEKPILFITKILGTYKKFSSEYMKGILKENAKSIIQKFKDFLYLFASEERKRKFLNLSNNIYVKSKDGSICIRTDGTRVVASRVLEVKNAQDKRLESYEFKIKGGELIET